MSDAFQVPHKAILTKDQLEWFQQSKTHETIVTYVQALNDSVIGKKLDDECDASAVSLVPSCVRFA